MASENLIVVIGPDGACLHVALPSDAMSINMDWPSRARIVTVPVPNDVLKRLRLQLEADAGAVPGCTGKCAKARGQAEAWEAVVAALDDALGADWIMRQGSGMELAVAAIADMASSLASLRADAEAVRQGERVRLDRKGRIWRRTHNPNYTWAAIRAVGRDCDVRSMAECVLIPVSALSALMARRQEEGQTDNG